MCALCACRLVSSSDVSALLLGNMKAAYADMVPTAATTAAAVLMAQALPSQVKNTEPPLVLALCGAVVSV